MTECDQEGAKIADLINQIGASTLVLGLHDQSFLYRYVFIIYFGLSLFVETSLVKFTSNR